MKKAIANGVDKAKPVKKSGRSSAHPAKVVAAKRSYSKAARQVAFSKMVSHLSAAGAVSQAKLISKVNPAEFRIVRMPG